MSAANVTVIAPEDVSCVFLPSVGKSVNVKPGESMTVSQADAEQLKGHGFTIKGEYTPADIDRLAQQALAQNAAETGDPQKPGKKKGK